MEKEIKKTQKDLYGELRVLAENAGNTELVEFIDKKVEQLQRKSTSKGNTAKQKENEGIKELILNVLNTSGKPMTIREIQAENETLETLSNQKVSALLRQLKETGEVIRTVDKKVAYFSVPLD